jgi:hypothetical protein
MADLELAFESSPVADGDQLAFIEGVLPDTKTTIELDLAGEVRLAAIAFESGFAGATMTVAAVVPWASGDANHIITGLSITVSAGEAVPVPVSDFFWPRKLLLTVSSAQTADKKIGFFGWRPSLQ